MEQNQSVNHIYKFGCQFLNEGTGFEPSDYSSYSTSMFGDK